MKPGLFAAVVIAVFALGFAVGRTTAPASAPAATSAAGFPTPAPVAPVAQREPPSMSGSSLSGTVAEVIQVPNYTYLRLQTGQGEVWAAVNATEGVAAGQPVTVSSATEMRDFASPTLKRTFASIYFGQLGGMGAPPVQAAGLPADHPPMNAPAAASPTAGAMAAIQKAQGPLGLRVSDVFSERMALSGRSVRVRGLVTKVNSVQGVNYVHLKDGSGSAATQDDDLTIITIASMKVDDVVELEGTVAVDKDLGMGSRPVVLENAKLVGN